MLRVPFADLDRALYRAMLHLGLHGDRAALCARLFAETTRDGVYTHGLDRFPRFAEMVANGSIDVAAEPTRVAAAAALERWDGHLGPGNLNAYAAMERAIALARQYGLGGVALANTNHWMRGGSYGWLAAESGLFAICWTNTLANLPAWGAASPTLGNNPLVVAIPRPDGAHVVLDMAVSQFSYGTISAYAARGEQLPVPGGYDATGELTTDAAAIEVSQRALPGQNSTASPTAFSTRSARPSPSIPHAPCATPASRRSACAQRTSASAFPSILRSGPICSRSRSRNPLNKSTF
jgi:3-dehydro-L-gulonate 2-dehydrogenase